VEPFVLAVAFWVVYLLESLSWLSLERLNWRHLAIRGERVPAPFQDIIDPETLGKIRGYSTAKIRLGAMEKLTGDLTLLWAFVAGAPAWLDLKLTLLGLHPVLAGLGFFAVLGIVFRIVALPFDYYGSFVIEERYGFNRTTRRIWITDLLKEGILSLVLLAVLLSPLLWLIRVSPGHWWLWGFLAVSAVQILLVVLYPVLIAPLFNKFEPFDEPGLAMRIRELMDGAGIRVKAILRMDAGKRSRHTNAYFTGLGKTKRIVLFDTLIESHPPDEILAVLAHEAGHLKGKHVLKQVVVSEAALLLVLYLTHWILAWPELYRAFGLAQPVPYIGLFILGVFWQKLGFFALPLGMAISRRFERQADHFATRLLGTPQPLIAGLKRLAVENLANLAPHPIYVWFHYSHPPLVERIETLAKKT
jgi:STE24 endopeptidase